MLRKNRTVPFTKPYWGKEEEHAVVAAMRGGLGTGDGNATAVLTKQLTKLLDVPYVHAVTSCTNGLEMAIRSLGVRAGDEVILPSFTLSATANAVVAVGGTPVFADIENDRLGIDPDDVARLITKRTKGIMVVHYAGMPCRIEEILALAKKHHLFVVEDAAHCIGATYRGQALGTFGDVGCFSFHGTKNVCCGEGGAVAMRSEELYDTMDQIKANGTNRRQFLRGQVDKYTWVRFGSSYFLSDLLAAILTAQIPKIPEINRKRAAVAAAYTKFFGTYTDILTTPTVPEGAKPNWHIYGIRFKKRENASMFLSGMRAKGIGVTTHYVPLHTSPFGKTFSGKSVRRLSVTEDVAETFLRLPMYPGLTKSQLTYITASARTILKDMS